MSRHLLPQPFANTYVLQVVTSWLWSPWSRLRLACSVELMGCERRGGASARFARRPTPILWPGRHVRRRGDAYRARLLYGERRREDVGEGHHLAGAAAPFARHDHPG